MTTKTPPALTDEELADLHRLARMYHREAKRARDAKAYLSACVMQGAVMKPS